MTTMWDNIKLAAGGDWEWEEAPPGRGGPGDYPEREEITRTGGAEDKPSKEDAYDDAKEEDWRRTRRKNNPPYEDWQDLGPFQDYAGRTFHARYRRGINHMIQAVDPNVDHSLDTVDNDHEAVIKWDPHSGEIKWRGRNSESPDHKGGYLTLALKHHAHKTLPEGIVHPHHSTNLTGPGASSLERFEAEHGDPYGDIGPALRGDEDEYEDDDDYDNDDDYDREDDDNDEEAKPEGLHQDDIDRLVQHGFQEDSTGQWNKSFNHPCTNEEIEEHTIQPDGRLEVYRRGTNGERYRDHDAGVSWSPSIKNTLDESRRGFAERTLPGEGWTPHYKDPAFDMWNTMQVHQPPLDDPNRDNRHLDPYKWTKTTPVENGDVYHHTLTFPSTDEAYQLHTSHNGGEPMELHTNNLSGDVLWNADRWETGKHPGGRMDNRMTHNELRKAIYDKFGRGPTVVAGDGRASYGYGDEDANTAKADRAYVDSDRTVGGPVNHNSNAANFVYDWDKGHYRAENQMGDHIVPGRQMALPLHTVSRVRVVGSIGRATDSVFRRR